MIREIIVTSPQGVRLAFTSTGDEGLEVMLNANSIYIRDLSRLTEGDQYQTIGIVPTSWLIELNENTT
jgi:hypothetical protein